MSFTDKQLHIIDIAERLFGNKGYDGTSVRDIADEADINCAMISYYFGSKEKLLQALFEERFSNMAARIESLIKNELLSPFEKVDMLVEDYVEKMWYKQQFHKVMMYEQMIEKNPAVTAMLNEMKKRNAEVIEKLIKEGQKKGVFKKNVDIVMLMNTIVGTASQAFLNREYYKNYNQLESIDNVDFSQRLKKKLATHIKNLTKAILSI